MRLPVWSEKHITRLLLLLLVILFLVYRSAGPPQERARPESAITTTASVRPSPPAVVLSPSAAEEEALRAKVALLERQLATALARVPASSSTTLTPPSFHCSDEQRLFQYENHDLVKPAICDTDSAWHLTQLALPDASTFIGTFRLHYAIKCLQCLMRRLLSCWRGRLREEREICESASLQASMPWNPVFRALSPCGWSSRA